MERLTFDNNGVPQFTHEGMIMYCNSMAMADCVYELENRLAAYEAAEEQGLFVRLPCKVGTPVWRVNFDKRKRPIQQEAFCAASIDMWEKTVFPSREEAEAALKEG